MIRAFNVGKHRVVISPYNTNDKKAEKETQKVGPLFTQLFQDPEGAFPCWYRIRWDVNIKYKQGNSNGKDTVTESFNAICAHLFLVRTIPKRCGRMRYVTASAHSRELALFPVLAPVIG